MLAENRTIGALLDMLIGAEKASQDFHLQLAKMFAHEPVAAAVWWKMAADEALHIWLLEQLKGTLSPDELSAPVNAEVWEKARAVMAVSPEAVLEGIRTLEDAYQTVHELEHYEFGAVLDFLFSDYFRADFQQAFINSQLREHLARLEELQTPEWRRSILAKK
ncbi:MAG: hypothetical protein ACUVTV_09375 [Anaerolineae bacterium]